jgi:uncharacterized damage-inducible protein DinB
LKESERIADQLRRANEKDAWHGPALKELLADVSAARAAARPIEGAHSIWELVLHVAAWQNAVAGRLGGEGGGPWRELQLSDAEDFPPVTDTSESAWRRALETLERSTRLLLEVTHGLTDEQLEKTVPGKNYSAYFMLHGAVQHCLYHAGQIAILKKAT